MFQPPFATEAIPVWLPRLLLIGVFFAVAYLVHRLAGRLAGRFVRLNRFTSRRENQRPERQTTLRGLIASAISLAAFVAATLASLSLFVSANTLVWMVGLFSAAFGLGARPLVNDFLTGLSLIFEDTYDVGEKVEILGVEGVVEAVNLRTTLLRSPSGETYVVPNGDVRLVRNFSRGRFSTVQVTVSIASADLAQTLPLLEVLGQEAVYLLPNLLEPWKIISETGALGQRTDLTLLTKARFGKGAEMRPRLLALVQERLTQAGIELSG
jgi:small conductance mechanosensitive channel